MEIVEALAAAASLFVVADLILGLVADSPWTTLFIFSCEVGGDFCHPVGARRSRA